MLDRLVEYGRQSGLKPEPGYKVKLVHWAIICGSNGDFLSVAPLGQQQGNRNSGLQFTKAPNLTQSQMTSGPKNCRHFLADSLAVVTLLGQAKAGEAAKAKHEFFKDLLRLAAAEVPSLKGLAAILDDPATLETINAVLTETGAKPTETASFQVDGVFVLESGEWHDWWNSWWQENCPLKLGKDLQPDLLTGEPVLPLTSHYKIAGLAGTGGQPSGDALVSFDKDAFQSYGLSASANAAFSPQSAVEYSEALNMLLRENSRNLAGAKVVYWFKERLPSPEDDLLGPLFGANEESMALDAHKQAKRLLQAIRKGERPDLGSNRYYAMTLSGMAGRVMLRDWMEGGFEELAASIDAWFDGLELADLFGGGKIKPPRINSLITCGMKPKKPKQQYSDWVKPVKWEAAHMWKAALNRRRPIPRSAMDRLVIAHNRAMVSGEYRNEQGKIASPALLYSRMALIKAYHIRQNRLNGQGGQTLHYALNENHPDPAYHCGRLMAILETVQNLAQGQVKAGVVTRFYSATAANPRLAFARLISLSNHHLDKMQKKESGRLAGYFKGQIASVMNAIADNFPASLDMNGQSLFALGYYHQLAWRKDQNQESPQTISEDRSRADD